MTLLITSSICAKSHFSTDKMSKLNFPNSLIRRFPPKRLYSISYYEMPERYRNSFYLANAALFDSVNWFLHRAYELGLPKLTTNLQEKHSNLHIQESIQMLDQCNSIIDVRFPITRQNGRREIIRGFRAQHGLYSGHRVSLGGLRIQEGITRDHMKALSVLATYKHACMGIAMAGAHGGLKINAGEYTRQELQQIIEIYVDELHQKGYCNGISDVVEPDLHTGHMEMSWIASHLMKKYSAPMNVAVGKPVELGGIEHHAKMASQGVFFALDYFLSDEKILQLTGVNKRGLCNKTFIIQGLGKLGALLAKYLENAGAICVGVKECDCYIHSPEGIDVDALLEHKLKHGSIINFTNAKPLQDDNIYKEQCDVLILAAHQKSLICYMADKIKAKVIVEAANGAITPTAHRILVGHGKLILPDVYVCSGYCIASYLEYLLNQGRRSNLTDCVGGIYKNLLDSFTVNELTRQVVSASTTQKIISCEMEPDVLTYAIEHVMTDTGNELLSIAKDFKLGLDIRMAAYIKATEAIHDGICKKKGLM